MPEITNPTHPKSAPQIDTEATEFDDAHQDTVETGEGTQDHTDERKLRKRAQSAEAERDTARAVAERLQHAEVQRLGADRLASPGDLLDAALGGVDINALLDADGLVDPHKVTAAVDALLEARPGLAVAALRKPIPGTYTNSGQFQSPRRPTPDRTDWGNVKLR